MKKTPQAKAPVITPAKYKKLMIEILETQKNPLTPRDHVAITAMNGLLAHYGNECEYDRLSELSYQVADAMLAERTKNPA